MTSGTTSSAWPFTDTPQDRVLQLIDGLKHMRLCIGTRWGHGNQGDYYLAKAKIKGPDDSLAVLRAFHITTKELGDRDYVELNTAMLPGYREHPVSYCQILIRQTQGDISISIDCPDYSATNRDYENAKFVDSFLTSCSHLMIDPPLDDKYCICPKYYPQLWPTTICPWPTSNK